MNTANNGRAAQSVSTLTATAIVVANMVGTGIFTSLGFQVGSLTTGFSIMVLWFVGGVGALCGALCYAELGAALPRSGGEYNFLGRIYHPCVGFLAGWVSATVGFAAPVALTAIAFGQYLAGVVSGVSPVVLSLAVVWICTLFLLRDIRMGSAFQNISTVFKVSLLVVIIGVGVLIKKSQPVSFFPAPGDGKLIASTPFVINLVYVMYAYSGWNASTYIVSEMRKPARSIPISVISGTLLVMVLYLLVNAVFLTSTPMAEMARDPNNVAVALIAGPHLFGETGTRIMSLFICICLVSSISAMMWIGPRVTVAMGEDLRAFGYLARKNTSGIPVVAILVQFAIVNILLLTSSFQAAVNYVQFTLTLCSVLVVAGVFVLRWRQPDLPRPYRTWGYPVTPLVFIVISGWMIWYMLASPSTRTPSLLGFATILAGLVIYFVSPKNQVKISTAQPAHEN